LDVFDAIKGRRSVRAFKKLDLPQEILEKILDAARWAPSAGNIQPWEFIVVRRMETKLKLVKAALDQRFIAEAPVVVVVCANVDMSAMSYGSRGQNLYCIQDTAAATQNILLATYALGAGACWIGAFLEDTVRKVLDLPPEIRPVAIVPIGYPAGHPISPSRRSLSEVVHEEKFSR
jgi:nitroreductase